MITSNLPSWSDRISSSKAALTKLKRTPACGPARWPGRGHAADLRPPPPAPCRSTRCPYESWGRAGADPGPPARRPVPGPAGAPSGPPPTAPRPPTGPAPPTRPPGSASSTARSPWPATRPCRWPSWPPGSTSPRRHPGPRRRPRHPRRGHRPPRPSHTTAAPTWPCSNRSCTASSGCRPVDNWIHPTRRWATLPFGGPGTRRGG